MVSTCALLLLSMFLERGRSFASSSLLSVFLERGRSFASSSSCSSIRGSASTLQPRELTCRQRATPGCQDHVEYRTGVPTHLVLEHVHRSSQAGNTVFDLVDGLRTIRNASYHVVNVL